MMVCPGCVWATAAPRCGFPRGEEPVPCPRPRNRRPPREVTLTSYSHGSSEESGEKLSKWIVPLECTGPSTMVPVVKKPEGMSPFTARAKPERNLGTALTMILYSWDL